MKHILPVSACLSLVTLALALAADGGGWFAQRLEVLRGEVGRFERGPDRTHAGFVKSRIDLGDALLVAREHEDAIRQYEQALALQEQAFQGLSGQDIVPGLTEHIRILTRIGNALLDSNRNGKALHILNKAVSLASWGVDSRDDVIRDLRTAHALALVHTLPIGEVDSFFRQLHESAVKAYPQAHPVLARILERWVVIHVANGRHAEAIALARQSLGIRENAYGVQHPLVAESLAIQASLEYAHGDRALVEGLLQRVLEIRLAAFGEDHPLTQAARENIVLSRGPPHAGM